ncbi:MAG: HAMP domain-containing sensor histidine kinase, partial [Bdellovibrionota bacterium]
MNKIFKKTIGWGLEGKILFVLLVVLVGVLVTAWGAAMKLRETVAANAAVMNVDPGALIEIENIENLSEALVSDSRAYFLMGSKSIFDKQQAEKRAFGDAIVKFERQYSLPQVPEILKKIEALKTQEQDFFDQAMAFREKLTESKIVGQFYQSKTSPLLAQMKEHFAELAKLHAAELAGAQERAREAGLEAQAQIPKGMTWLTQALGLLFLCTSLLVVRVMRVRSFHLRERDRLVEEAKKAILSRDEVIAAASQDFREPLKALDEIADGLNAAQSPADVAAGAEAVKSTISEMRSLIEDIQDQKKADMGQLALRLDQLRVADILEEAQVMLQPLAKQRGMTLQFDAVNPSILAFADKERVLRVISNVIGNAVKFGPKHSRITVKVKADQQFANISIADSGPGIPEHQLGSLFEKFWQARSTSEQGAGVGLAVVKTIIEAHGGTVRAESNLSGGTTITFSLPRRRPVGAQLRKPTA